MDFFERSPKKKSFMNPFTSPPPSEWLIFDHLLPRGICLQEWPKERSILFKEIEFDHLWQYAWKTEGVLKYILYT